MASAEVLRTALSHIKAKCEPMTGGYDTEAEELGILIGTNIVVKDIVVGEMGLHQTRQSEITKALVQLGCIVVEKRGAAGTGSTILYVMDYDEAVHSNINSPKKIFSRERSETNRLEMMAKPSKRRETQELEWRTEELSDRQTDFRQRLGALEDKVSDHLEDTMTGMPAVWQRLIDLQKQIDDLKNIPRGNAGQGPGDTL